MCSIVHEIKPAVKNEMIVLTTPMNKSLGTGGIDIPSKAN